MTTDLLPINLIPADDNLYATVQDLPALAAQPFPIGTESNLPIALPTCPSDQVATPTDEMQCAA